MTIVESGGRAFGLALATLTMMSVAQDSAPSPARQAFFEARAHEFRKSHGLADAKPEDLTFGKVLDDHYVRIQLGLFDTRYPGFLLADRNRAKELQAVATALLDLQSKWLEWVAKDPAAAKEAQADVKVLKTWIHGWKLPALAGADKSTERDLCVLLGATKEQVAAGSRLAASMAAGTPLGLARADAPPCRLVISPTRRHFVELVGFIGTLNDSYRSAFWIESVTRWTELWLAQEGGTQVIALEYASPAAKEDFAAAMDMNAREKTGLLQHVAQRATFSLVTNYCGPSVALLFQSALAQNLVIAVYGENNARSGGNERASDSADMDTFIPGAPGMGGSLPSSNADSAWRHTRGADYFLRPLRRSQKSGGSEGPDKGPDKGWHFLVLDDSEREKHVVAAPFLGRAAKDKKQVPQKFLADYLEFHRAYRSGFLHWLQEHGGGNAKAACKEKFAEVVRRLCAPKEGRDFEGVCEEVYGVPLSAAGHETDCLEGRFLAWLSHQS